MSSAAPPNRRPRRERPLSDVILIIALFAVPLIALSQFVAYWRTDVVDDQMFAYFGWRIANGATVYLDVWDNKPPGIYWINALGMFLSGGHYLGITAMTTLALVVSLSAFFIVAGSVYHRGAAAVTTILATFFITHVRYTGGTNRTEVFVVACELVAMAFYLRGWARDQWWKWYAAGLAAGLGFLFKQVGLAAWGCMGLHLLILMGTRELRIAAGVRRGLLLVAGAASTVGLAALVLAAQGALGEALYATFGFNRAYFAAGDSRFPYNIVNIALLKTQIDDVMLAPLLMAAAAILHAFLWWRSPQQRPPEIEEPLRAQRPVCPRYFLLFFLWGVVAFYGAILSPHGFRHYLVPWFPPLLLVGGYLINVLRTEVSLLTRMQQRAWVTVAIIILAYFAKGALFWQLADTGRVWIDRIEKREVAEWEYVGEAVARHSRPDERVQIWGFLPGAYLTAKRVNASRYFTTEKVGQVGKEAQHIVDEIEATVRADPPAVIVLSHHERSRMQGVSHPPSEFSIYPWIEEHYTMVEELPKHWTYYVYRRNRD